MTVLFSRYYGATEIVLDDIASPNIDSSVPCDGFIPASHSAAADEPAIRPVQISPNATLTALAQLGALKFQSHRSFIGLIDHTSHYVLAEATRSVSLRSETVHGEGDELYLGIQSLPLYWGVCPSTMKTFTESGDRMVLETSNVSANHTRYIVRDFTKDERLKDRPYVLGWPYMRFYAEVPIMSATGYVIGGYCIIDNKAREDFSDADVTAMKEIAASVSEHLELMRMKQDSVRAEKLMRGLGSFVEGQSSMRPKSTIELQQPPAVLGRELELAIASSETPDVDGIPAETTGSVTSDRTWERKEETTDQSDDSDCRITPSVVRSASDANTLQVSITSQTVPEPSALALVVLPPAVKNPTPASPTPDSLVPGNIKRTFSRASNLIREGMELCGVEFFDAYLSGLAVRSDPRQSRPNHSEDSTDDASVSSSEDDWLHSHVVDVDTNEDHGSSTSGHTDRKGRTKKCERLGHSLSPILTPGVHRRLSGALLQRLLRKYPYGEIFTSEESRIGSNSGETSRRTSQLLQNDLHQPLSRERKKALARQAESRLLFDLLPGAKSIVFYPLWDSHKARWFAGCLAWTTDAKRAQQKEEITYLAAFGNSIMVEINRIEAVANDRAKSDFISNISHELRSPLHGILASAELLQDSSTGPEQDGMIEMVNCCGRTLLDTMNHLLDYAKINNIAKSKKAGFSGSPETDAGPDSLGLTSQFDLSELVEEVVEAVHTGYQYQKRLSASFKDVASDFAASGVSNIAHAKILPDETKNGSSDMVSVILDVRERRDWVISSEAGAWKRIVMNIFGNALKYTKSGYVKVTLSTDDNSPPINGSSGPMVRLSFTDTGKGISVDYLKNRLYMPFAQEDHLSVGAGLGLSIVQQIVTSLGGTVDIQSQVDVGTSVTVSIPLKPRCQGPIFIPGIPPKTKQCRGMVICLVGFGGINDVKDCSSEVPEAETRRRLHLQTALTQVLVNRFGLHVAFTDSIELVSADLLIVEDEYLKRLQRTGEHYEHQLMKAGNPPLVVLCRDPSRQLTPPTKGKAKVAYLSQPFGPIKLGKVLEICLRSRFPAPEFDATAPDIDVTPPQVDAETSISERPGSANSLATNPVELPQAHPVGYELVQTTSARVPKVLLVDDNDINLKIMVTYMRKLGYDYVTATDGLQALERYRDAAELGQHFQYVLMDVSMPIMDGLTATQEIRAFERTHALSKTTIIALTGLASLKTEEEAYASGVTRFLTKPVRLKTLKDVLLFQQEDGFSAKQVNGRLVRRRKPTFTQRLWSDTRILQPMKDAAAPTVLPSSNDS